MGRDSWTVDREDATGATAAGRVSPVHGPRIAVHAQQKAGPPDPSEGPARGAAGVISAQPLRTQVRFHGTAVPRSRRGRRVFPPTVGWARGRVMRHRGRPCRRRRCVGCLSSGVGPRPGVRAVTTEGWGAGVGPGWECELPPGAGVAGLVQDCDVRGAEPCAEARVSRVRPNHGHRSWGETASVLWGIRYRIRTKCQRGDTPRRPRPPPRPQLYDS